MGGLNHSARDDGRLRRTLRLSVADGALYAVMLGVGESYLGALAVELGHTDTALALLGTVPLLIGAIAQLAAGRLTRLAGGPRRMVVIGSIVQALSQAGLVAIALTGERGLWPLLAIKTLFWTSGAVLGPTWSAWMAALVSGPRRERFFAWRGAAGYLALVIAYLGAGLLLEQQRAAATVMQGFAVLFGVAIAARLASALCLGLHVDPPAAEAQDPTPRGGVREAVRLGHWRIAALVAALGFGVHFSSPFYTPYMLRELQLDFRTYAGLLSVAILVKALVFPLMHRIGARVGLTPLAIVAGFGMSILPVLWAVVPDVWALAIIECFSGVVWAAFEFSTVQLLLVGAPASCRVEYLALAGAAAGVAQIAGALCGSALIAAFALSYTDIFALAGGLRLVAVVAVAVPILPLLRQARLRRLFVVPAGVRSVAGVVVRPIVRNRRGGRASFER